MSISKKYYPFLDGFRGISILWVLFHHTNIFFNPHNIFNAPPIVLRIAYLGFLGVDMFFVISGFLITGLLLEEFNTKIRIKRFYSRRFFKIIPQYFLTIITGLIIIKIFDPRYKYTASSILSYFAFYQNYTPPYIPLFGHTWSIAVEEHFYLIYPILLQTICLIEKNIKRRKLILFILFIALIFLGNILRYFAFHDLDLSSRSQPPTWQTTHIRFDALIFGCLLKILEPYFYKNSSLKQTFIPALYFTAGYFIYVSFIFRFNKIGWFFYILAYLAPGFLLISALKGFAPIKAITENKMLRWVGKNSYGIYLWHYILVLPTKITFSQCKITYLSIIIYLILSISIGALTTITIEHYFLNLRKKLIP